MIKLNNVNKIYKTKHNEIHALKDINLSFGDSGLVFVLGKSGCGKSTMLNILGGLDSVTSGEIIVNDENITNLKQSKLDYFRNYNVGFVFQDYNLIDEYNVFENIELALDLQGDKNAKDKITQALEMVELTGYEKRKISEMSGGQQQRVAIARALVKNTTYLLADEPTGNLDSVTGEEIFNLLKEISKDKLIIVVTHDKESAEKYGDRIIHMKDGVIIDDTEVENVEKTCENPSKIDTKLKKNSPKQIFKFALRNMWRRRIRLASSIILCAVCLGIFGLSLSFVNFDYFGKYLPVLNEYKGGYKFVNQTFEEDYEVAILDKETLHKSNELFGGAIFPVYISNGVRFGVLTEDNIKFLPHFLNAKIDGRDSIIPQKYNEVVKVSSWDDNHNVTLTDVFLAGYTDCETIADISLDFSYDEQEQRKYYQAIIDKKETSLDSPNLLELKQMTEEDIEEKINTSIYLINQINYFVHPDFVKQALPNRAGDNYIAYVYDEWVCDRKGQEYSKTRSSGGYFYKLAVAQQYVDEIVFLPKYAGKTTLKNNEVLIGLEQAKVLLSGMDRKLPQNISDEDAIDAIKSGKISSITLTSYNLDIPVNAKIVGYYKEPNDDYFKWRDDKYNGILDGMTGIHRYFYEYAPFIVSDYLYNGDSDVISDSIGLFINFENIEFTKENFNFLNQLLKENPALIMRGTGIFNEIYHYYDLYDHNISLVKPVWMYVSLGISAICIIAILSYIWAVIHDSKRKIGILRAQGMTTLSIIAIYLIETLVMCMIAIFIGSLLALILSHLPMFTSVLQILGLINFKMNSFGILEVLAICGFGVAIGLLGAIIPILLNANKTPISLIKEKK